MKSLMYHYVRPDSPGFPWFRNLDAEEFRRQLDWLESRNRFIEYEHFLSVIDGRSPVPRDHVVLTFDDGLIDHHEFVFSELKRRSLWGIFYVTTGVFASGKMLSVHLVHYLLGRFGGDSPLQVLERVLEHESIVNRKQFEEVTYLTQSNDESTLKFKKVLNYFVHPDQRDTLVRRVFREFVCDLDESAWYVSADMLREMHESGMVIGSHSVSHPVFSTLPVDQQRQEIVESFQFLDDTLGRLPVRTFCYPYGGVHSYTEDTISLLDAVECRFAFDVDAREIRDDDLVTRRQCLPRYDCNMFPHGQCTGVGK